MLTQPAYPAPRPPRTIERPSSGQNGLSRLFATAVVNPQFRETLLRDPKVALASGYRGQPFLLTEEEQRLLNSIQAESLTELARKINHAIRSK